MLFKTAFLSFFNTFTYVFMIYKTKDNLNLYCEVTGNLQSTKTLVFLNGLSQSTLAWILTTPYFKSEYKIVLLDFIFQGQSEKNAEVRNFDQHATDVKGVLDELKIEKANIIGLSYGSLVAQHFALLFPERLEKLILMSTFAHKTPYFEAIELAWGRALESGGYSLLFDIMLPSVLGEEYFKNPIIPIELMKQTRSDANNDAQALLKLMRATKDRPDYREKIKNIKTPTLIIHGEKDLLLLPHMAEAVHKSILGSALEIIPRVGHTLNLEAIPQSVTLIKEFLAK
ncbi:MAG TPA: alpha/beta hydrolase [Bacteroidia bacterium]|jgi:3-oxoadipate enol-lactonase|nr:alpha/beta hydrolase [Bacteroidia bacterium]